MLSAIVLRQLVETMAAVDGMTERAAVRITAVKSFASGEPLGRLRDLTAALRPSVCGRCRLSNASRRFARLCRAWDLLQIGSAGRLSEIGHRLNLHVAVLQLPLVILFQQNIADQPDD